VQSAPAALDPLALPPVSTIMTPDFGGLRPVTLTFESLTFDLKTGTQLSRAVGNVMIFLRFFFRVASPYGTDGQTDGQDA